MEKPNLNLTIVCAIKNTEFNKKTNDMTKVYKAVILQNVDNKSQYVCVNVVKADLHDEFVSECKQIALDKLGVKEKDYAEIHVNDILI